jgi:hypothetical protein
MPWASIETAPKGSGKDGPWDVRHPEYVKAPHLLLWTSDGAAIGYYDWYYHKGFGRGAHLRESAWCDSNGEEIQPSHWMSIPDGPETKM